MRGPAEPKAARAQGVRLEPICLALMQGFTKLQTLHSEPNDRLTLDALQVQLNTPAHALAQLGSSRVLAQRS
jgi:PIN domain nuclease of toxin-antitoxin system